MKEFKEKLREARKSKGLTLEKLSEAVGSSKSYMWQLETKSEIKPSADMINKLSKALDLSANFLIDPEIDEMDEEQEAIILFRDFKDLDETSKNMIRQQIKHLKKLQKE